MNSKVEISITSLTFLVTLIENLKLDDNTQKELLKLYYESLMIGKKEGFVKNTIKLEGCPNLLKFLDNNSLFKKRCNCYFYEGTSLINKNKILNIFIGGSSRNDIPKQYLDDCNTYLEGLFNYETNLVFGASNDGLMGISYNMAKDKKRDIIGICPNSYQKALKKLNCNKQIITKTVQERTSKLFELSDALVFLPGGIGTIYEFFQALECKRTNEFDKPIILYNSCGYFNTMLEFIDEIYLNKFADIKDSKNYHISNSSKDTITYINDYYEEKENNKINIKKQREF